MRGGISSNNERRFGESKHYENTPIQIYRTFHLKKIENFQTKTQIFLIFLLKT